MKNYVQNGDVVTVTAPKAVASGGGVLVGCLFGIACSSAAEGESLEISTRGVFDLPKAADTIFAAGDRAAWDGATGVISLMGPGLLPVGVALTAAGNSVPLVRVRLDGVATAAGKGTRLPNRNPDQRRGNHHPHPSHRARNGLPGSCGPGSARSRTYSDGLRRHDA